MDAARTINIDTEPTRKAAPPLLWQKAGTIERILRNAEIVDGERWPYAEKLVAIHLLTYAVTTHAEPRCTVGLEKLANQLGMSRKTFATHVAGLAQRGLIEYERDRDRGGMTFYLRALVRRFAEGGTGLAGGSLSAISQRQMGNSDASADKANQMGKSYPSGEFQMRHSVRSDGEDLPISDASILPISSIDLVTPSRTDVVERVATTMIDVAKRHPLQRPKAITHAAKWRTAWRAPIAALLDAGYAADELLAMVAAAEKRLADYPHAEWGIEFVTSALTWADPEQSASRPSRSRRRRPAYVAHVDPNEPDWDAIGRGEIIQDDKGRYIPNPDFDTDPLRTHHDAKTTNDDGGGAGGTG